MPIGMTAECSYTVFTGPGTTEQLGLWRSFAVLGPILKHIGAELALTAAELGRDYLSWMLASPTALTRIGKNIFLVIDSQFPFLAVLC